MRVARRAEGARPCLAPFARQGGDFDFQFVFDGRSATSPFVLEICLLRRQSKMSFVDNGEEIKVLLVLFAEPLYVKTSVASSRLYLLT